LSDTARTVLAHVEREPVHLDVLHEALERDGVDFGALSTALLELEMKGLIRHLPGNLYTAGSAV
jgi:predicted Rossmann fold nucleotide-binding protein DprA/Smf involved in DNA uptake